MNNSVKNILGFLALVFFQVAVFNKINLFGYINPFPYILFIILYPANGNKLSLLLWSFVLGLTIDMFCDTGGFHTTSCLVLAFIRPNLLRFSFGQSYEYQNIKLNNVLTPERFLFILAFVFIHHLLYFILEFFSFYLLWEIIFYTFTTTVFTLIISIIIIYLIKPNRR